jgi:nucleoside-diphosphate-sugar epimerase
VKACVVGATGFLGRRIVSRLASADYEVIAMDVASPKEGELPASVAFQRVDVTSFEETVAAFVTHRPDLVVHLSFTRENLPRTAFRLNVQGMDNCLEAARLAEVGRVLYSSSIAVYGAQSNYGERPIIEDDRPSPRKQYDVHKVFNEWQAKEYAEKHGMSVIGVRLANVSGSDKAIGSVDHVACIVEPARGRPVTLDKAKRMRSVIHGDDASEIFLRLAQADKPRHAIYNSGGEALSLGQIAEMVKKVLPDAQIRFEDNDTPPKGHSAYLFDNSRLTEEFGLSFMPYDQRIARMIGSVRSRI